MSWRDQALVGISRMVVKPVLHLPLPWGFYRGAARLFARPLKTDCGITQSREIIGGVSCVVFAPPSIEGTVLWIHGGGFVMGSAKMYAHLAAALALGSGRRVVLPEYRLAPEHPFPAGPDDCMAVARAVAATGPFALGGDSAGGTLALVALADLLSHGFAPDCLILASPAVDLNPDRRVPDARGEILFPVSMLRRVAQDYAGHAEPHDPRVSPVHACFAGAPPVLIQCATGEILEGDSDAICERLRADGAQVELQRTEGVPHVWQLFAGRTPKADQAVAAMASFLRAHR